MAYPKVPTNLKRKGIGLSLDPDTIARIEALSGGTGERSEFIREMMFAGLERRFGPNWAAIADAMQSEVAVEVEASVAA